MQIGFIIIGTLSLFAGLGFATGYLTAKREFEVNLPGEETEEEFTINHEPIKTIEVTAQIKNMGYQENTLKFEVGEEEQTMKLIDADKLDKWLKGRIIDSKNLGAVNAYERIRDELITDRFDPTPPVQPDTGEVIK